MYLKLWLESGDSDLFQLALVQCQSTGSHGYGGSPEVPAKPPKMASVQWEIPIRNYPQAEQLLHGLPVMVLEDKEGGSYHERWQKIHVYVIATEEIAYQLDQIQAYLPSWNGKPGNRYDSLPQMTGTTLGRFSYAGPDDLIKQVVQMARVKGPNGEMPPSTPTLPPPTQSSEEWWKKQVQHLTAGKPPTRNTGRGHEQKWDGD